MKGRRRAKEAQLNSEEEERSKEAGPDGAGGIEKEPKGSEKSEGSNG